MGGGVYKDIFVSNPTKVVLGWGWVELWVSWGYEKKLIIKDKKSKLKEEKYPWFIYGQNQFKTDKQIIDLQFTCKNFTNDEPNIVFKLNFKS